MQLVNLVLFTPAFNLVSFAAFEAIADGDEVELTVKEGSSGGWTNSNCTSDSRGKWEGGVRPATMEAKRIVKEKPSGPPPKRNLV